MGCLFLRQGRELREIEGEDRQPDSEEGVILKGHEFHYSRIDGISAELAFQVVRGEGIKDKIDGASAHKTLGMFAYLHYLSCPDVPRTF